MSPKTNGIVDQADTLYRAAAECCRQHQRYARLVDKGVAVSEQKAALEMAYMYDDLLATAMRDRIHQPYRIQACPLLGRLMPLSGAPGFLGVALSGAGPSVLMVTDRPLSKLLGKIREAAEDPDVEILETAISTGTEFSGLSEGK